MKIIRFISKNKAVLLKILDIFPVSMQKWMIRTYRKWFASQIYGLKAKNSFIYDLKKGKYSIPENIGENIDSGVNLIGFPKGDFGLGEHLRSVGQAIEAAKIEHQYYDCGEYFTGNYSNNSVEDKIKKDLKYNSNIFVINGDGLAILNKDLGDSFFSNRYNIHYGAWELSKYPEEWISTLSLVDEYWAMSSFLQKSVSDVAKIPVLHMPYPVDFTIPTRFSRKDFGLPEDKFLYIFTFDMSSLAERKNPQAVIKAFMQAFPKEKDVGLVIKVSSKKDFKTHKDEISEIISSAKGDKRIFLIDEVLPREKILALINSCDVYVSLHRAEGFGIGMAEAMKMGKVVIATNYSGNTDFTLSNNSCLVDYNLIPIKPLEYIYEKGKFWADANVEHASFYMKKLFEDKQYYKSIAEAGKKHIEENYSAEKVKTKYIERLKILGLLNN